MTIDEIWKDVIGFEGFYEVSSLGRVKNSRTGKIIGSKARYVKVTLQVKGKISHKLAHRLVAEAFIPNPKNKPTVNHRNGNKHDNTVDNLEWATYSENMQHAFDNGYKIPFFRGESRVTKLDKDDIFAVQVLIKRGSTNKVISELFNVSPSLISMIRNGKSS